MAFRFTASPSFTASRFRTAPSTRILVAALASSLLLGGVRPGSSAEAATSSVKSPPVADAYVISSKKAANFGTATTLRTKYGSPAVTSYLRFDMGSAASSVTRASLTFYSKTGSSTGVQIRGVAGNWQEATITYNNAPEPSSEVAATSGSFKSSTWVTVDITTLVKSTGAANLALTTRSGSYINLTSRESGKAPKLTVETSSAEAGATYYVDPAGSDANSGTSPAKPWQSLQKVASATLQPGDSVLFNRGKTWTGSLSIGQSGTSMAPVVFGAYGAGELPVIQGGGSCIVLSGSYIVVSEVQARGCSWAGIEIKGRNNRIENSVFAGNVTGVSITSSGMNNAVVANQIKDNNKMSVLTQSPANDDSGAFGLLIHGDDNEVAFNTISGSYAFSYDYGQDGAAVEIYGGRRNHIHHNNTSENDTFAELGHPDSAGNIFAYNAVRSTLAGSLFLVTRGPNDVFGPVSGTVVVNNSVLLTGSQSQGFVCYAGCGPDILKMRNNVIQAVWKVGYADNAFDEDFNLYWGGQKQWPPAGTSNLTADPVWMDPAGGDLHLRSTSQGVDSATPLDYSKDLDGFAVPLDGNADGRAVPDRGALEFRG